jgi:hypothetical protein
MTAVGATLVVAQAGHKGRPYTGWEALRKTMRLRSLGELCRQ